MSKQSIIIVIALMSLALIGTTVIQYLWIKRWVDLQELSFDDKAMEALHTVNDELISRQKHKEDILKLPNYNKNNPITGIESFQSQKRNTELEGLAYIFDRHKYLENISPGDLDELIKKEFQSRGINTEYDYGIWSTKSKSFSILNGNFVVEEESAPQSSQAEIQQLENQNLYQSKYFVELFRYAEQSPGELKVYFPKKTSYLWSSSLGAMISALIFTSLILLCFIYTINVILFQKRVSEMKTDFINNMTHEFKTPIATISLAADSINSPKVNSSVDKVKRYANIIKQENKRMLGQVEKVLQMAQLEKSDFQLKVTEFDVHELIKTAAEHSRLKVNKRNGTVALDLQADKTQITADNNHISNVIHNLLDNAEKYSKDIPEIAIKTFNSSNGINIQISDKGIGMSKDALKNIFEKFYRVHTGNLHDVKGFGLGLSYVKAIVNAHKGDIKVVSMLGEGSSFTIFLPFSSSNSD